MLDTFWNIKIILAVISGLIVILVAFLPYFRDMFLRRTKPHVYTWLIWTITQGTATVAGFWEGKGGWGMLALAIGTVFTAFIFLLSLKYGTKNITKGDSVVLVIALLAIIVWWQLKSPLLAVFMVSAIDFLGYIPSFRKTFEEPWTETSISWAAFSVSNFLSILALSSYNFLTLTFIITITVANIILLTICLLRRRVISAPSVMAK